GKPAPKVDESPSQPTSSLAEFETARATNEDWAQTRQAIEDVARKNPGNTLYLFALARHLTYRDATRREAIRMLAGLPARVSGQRDTRKTWRQALVALEARSEDAPLYAAYLAQNPDDAAIRDQLRALSPKETPREGFGMAPRSSAQPASGNVQGNQAKASVLMKQALADEQNAVHGAAAAKLESAMLLDPGNTSVRLALARQYQNLGMIGSAESLLDDLLAASPALPEALHARAVLYGAQQKWLDGIKLMERIPASRRTTAVAIDQRRMWLNVQVQRARQLYARGDAKKANTLMEVVQSTARADDRMMPTVASGWSEVGQSAKGLRLMRQFVSASPPQDVTTRIRYAEILLANYQDAELSAVLRDLATPGRLDSVQQTEVNAIILGYTLRLAEALRESGRIAEAAELMGPVMQRADDTRALLTMARIHRAASDPLQALALVEKAIVLEPDELGHRLLASEMALAIKAIDKADGQAKAALALAPNHPRALAAAGRVEKYRGNFPKALTYFERAQSQEREPQAFAGVAGNLALRLVDGEPSAATTPSTGKSPGEERSGLLPIPGPAPKSERRPDTESGYDTQRPGLKKDLPSMRIDQPGRLSQVSMGPQSPASGVASVGRQSVLYQMPQMLPPTNLDYRDMAAFNAAQQGATATTGIKLKLTTTLANPVLTRSPGKLL
ncbi:MAG: hypothetical protein H7315_05425, partial [Herminiimonas sp.]|nr:hypothetical protein [Herminiimonas sp.]